MILHSTRIREVEANPLKTSGPIFGFVKNKSFSLSFSWLYQNKCTDVKQGFSMYNFISG